MINYFPYIYGLKKNNIINNQNGNILVIINLMSLKNINYSLKKLKIGGLFL